MVSGLFGQSYRLSGEDDPRPDSGLDGSGFSDYVGRIDVRPTDWSERPLSLPNRPEQRDADAQRGRREWSAPWRCASMRQLSLAEGRSGARQVERRARGGDRRGRAPGVLPWLSLRGAAAAQPRGGPRIFYRSRAGLPHPCLEVFAGMQRRFTDDRDADGRHQRRDPCCVQESRRAVGRQREEGRVRSVMPRSGCACCVARRSGWLTLACAAARAAAGAGRRSSGSRRWSTTRW